MVRQQRPELAVVDIWMPPKHATEGLDAARVIQREFPETAVVVLSAQVEVEYAMDLIASGQRAGYLLKSRVTDVTEFIDTLRRVLRGGSAAGPVLVQELTGALLPLLPLVGLICFHASFGLIRAGEDAPASTPGRPIKFTGVPGHWHRWN